MVWWTRNPPRLHWILKIPINSIETSVEIDRIYPRELCTNTYGHRITFFAPQRHSIWCLINPLMEGTDHWLLVVGVGGVVVVRKWSIHNAGGCATGVLVQNFVVWPHQMNLWHQIWNIGDLGALGALLVLFSNLLANFVLVKQVHSSPNDAICL